MSGGISTDFSNSVRSVMQPYEILRADSPFFISQVSMGNPFRNTKAEWQEHSTSQLKEAISGVSGNDCDVADGTKYKVGDVLQLLSSTEAPLTEQVVVASIATNTLTLTRAYAGTTGVTLADGQIVSLISRPRAESSSVETGDYGEPSMAYNYTEIFDEFAEVSGTAQEVQNYGWSDAMAWQEAEALDRIIRKQNNSFIWGTRYQSGSTRTAGGLRYFLTQSGGNIVAGAGGALSATKINEGFKKIFEKGGSSNNYRILCAPNQAQKISGFNTSGTNPVVRVDQGSTRAGEVVTTFIGDIPANGGYGAQVFVDPNCPVNEVFILDMNKLEIAPLGSRTFTSKDAKGSPGDDYWRTRLMGEYTNVIRDSTSAHAIINNLSI